jgi:HK97 family phage portal protein
MKFQQMSINATDSQLLQSREFSVDEIARWFHVPPALLSSTKGTFSSLEMLLQMFYGNCLSAHIASIESEFNKKLLRPSEQSKFSIYFDTNELLRAIKKDSAQYYQILVTSGILTPNEARADLGYAPIEGGDELRIAYSDAGQNALTPNNDNDKQEDQE